MRQLNPHSLLVLLCFCSRLCFGFVWVTKSFHKLSCVIGFQHLMKLVKVFVRFHITKIHSPLELCFCISIYVGCVCLMSHYYVSWLLQFPLCPGLLRINLIGWYVIWVSISDLLPLWGYLVSANCSHLRGFGGQADVLAWILGKSKWS